MSRRIEGRLATLEATSKSRGHRLLIVGQLDGESNEDLEHIAQQLKSELPSPPDLTILLRYCGTEQDGKRFVKVQGYGGENPLKQSGGR